jgi:hypothetical protein
MWSAPTMAGEGAVSIVCGGAVVICDPLVEVPSAGYSG